MEAQGRGFSHPHSSSVGPFTSHSVASPLWGTSESPPCNVVCACLGHQCQEQALNPFLPASKNSSMVCRHGVPSVLAASLHPCSPHYSAPQKPQPEDPPVCWRMELWLREVGLTAGAGWSGEVEGRGSGWRDPVAPHSGCRGLSVGCFTHI